MTEELLIKGRVRAGPGKGKYFMSLEHYGNEFKLKLGFKPYPGTLNLELSGEELINLEKLRKEEGILVKGFRRGNECFGWVKCFYAEIKKIKCAVILPEKSEYKNVVEVICKECLREKLRLRNGADVEVTVSLRK